MKNKIIGIFILSLLLIGCSSNTNSYIEQVPIDETTSTKINLLYPYFVGFSMHNITKGKIVVEAYNQESSTTTVTEYNLADQQIDEIYMGLTTFTFKNPSFGTYDLKLVTIENNEENNNNYRFETNCTLDSISNSHYEQNLDQNESFKLLSIYYGFNSSIHSISDVNISNIEELNDFYNQCIYAYCIYYVGE